MTLTHKNFRRTIRFGHSPAISQLLTVPPYVFASRSTSLTPSHLNTLMIDVFPTSLSQAIVLYTFAHFSDKLQKRSPFILAGLFMCLIGFSINISDTKPGVKYFGTFFCVAGSYAAFPGVVAW